MKSFQSNYTNRSILLLLCAHIALIAALLSAPVAAEESQENNRLVMRAAIVAYPNLQDALSRAESVLKEQIKASRFNNTQMLLAPGTAGDVVAWADRGEIDLALVPIGVFAEILARRSDFSSVSWKQIAELKLTGSHLGPEIGPTRSVCVRQKGAEGLHSVADLKQLSKNSGLVVYFSEPFSASGRILPHFAFQQLGVSLRRDSVRFAKSHEGALMELLRTDSPGQSIACVSFEVFETFGQRERLTAIEIPLLDQIQIPGVVVIAREDNAGGKSAAGLFSVETSTFKPAQVEGRATPATSLVRSWAKVLGSSTEHRAAQELTLDQLSETLIDYRQQHASAPRLAVVFAGGGAKCAYQVGAIRALEEKLALMRKDLQDPSFDISIVVGTSGGALNALPVALGISSTMSGWQDLVRIWENLDQRQIIQPSTFVRTNMILWFVCVQGLILLRYRKHKHYKNPNKYPWIISEVFIPIGIVEILLARMPYKPWGLLGTNGMLHHFWLWLTWGLEGSGWLLIVLGLGSLVLRRFPAIQASSFYLRFRVVRSLFWLGLLLLPLLQLWVILFLQENLSSASGIEKVLISSFRDLIDGELQRQGKPLLSKPRDLVEVQLDLMSEETMSRGIFKRDLVLTGSSLPASSLEAGGDLYFFVPATNSTSPRFGTRGVNLGGRPQMLFDAVIGSGAIYPVFPARELEDFPVNGARTELVDGSFDHRSPIEAAVLWGATHVVLVQAATDETVVRGSFLANVNAAINHLYDQAQLLDMRSKEEVTTFTLTPQPPHIGLLDFSDNLIRLAIEKGYQEAGGLPLESSGIYRKEFGPPRFREIRVSGR